MTSSTPRITMENHRPHRLGRGFLRGIWAFIDGIIWLRTRPMWLLALALPWFAGVVCALVTLGWLFHWDPQISAHVPYALGTPTDALGDAILHGLMRGLLWLSYLAAGGVAGILVVAVIASPLYERVSIAVEKSVSGGKVAEISFWREFWAVVEQFKKALFILMISIFLLCIPGLNVISTVITAFLMAWDLYEYPLLRRGWSFAERRRRVREDAMMICGLSLWFMVPFTQILFYPLAVVGASLMALESLQTSPHPRHE